MASSLQMPKNAERISRRGKEPFMSESQNLEATNKALEEAKEPEIATEAELDEMTGGLNLVNKASCTNTTAAMNTVVSIGGV